MNYNHPIQFGIFITPRNNAPETVVALARRSEELGYDLVTFQDHPYQPAFLDTWTLMSWVAGQTERIHIAANVLNVPLRAPAILARSAASLDLLSGGRLDLALGAGAFWEAIEAMGDGDWRRARPLRPSVKLLMSFAASWMPATTIPCTSRVATITSTGRSGDLCQPTTSPSGWERTNHACCG